MSQTLTQLENALNEILKDQKVSVVVPFSNILPVVDYTEFLMRPQTCFVADDIYEVVSATEIHDIAQTSADGCSLMISKVSGTTAPSAAIWHLVTDTAFEGDDATYKGFNLKGTAATVQNATMTTTASTLELVPGDRLVWGVNGTISTISGSFTVQLKRKP
jgi:hypothetical protein